MPLDRAAVTDLAPDGRLPVVARELWRYGLCSAVALATDMGVLLIAHHLIGAHYQLAAALGFAAGLVVAYELSVRYVFERRRLENKRVEFMVFVVIGVLGLVITQGLLHVLVEHAGLPVGIAKIPTAGFVFLFNFTARRLALFSPAR